MAKRSWIALVVAAVALATLPASPPAQAQDGGVVVTLRSTFYPGDDELAPLTLTVKQGLGLTIHNLDAFAGHQINSDDGVWVDNDFQHLFESVAVNFRDSAPVTGVESLAPGTYGFHCAVHEDNMHGTLVVL